MDDESTPAGDMLAARDALCDDARPLDDTRIMATAQTTQRLMPRFDTEVADSGYRWWYVDGISDDGRNGIVVIAFIGSVFSPYYFRARARGPTDPQEHCAINVGLYRRRGKLWAMTERSRRAIARDVDWFQVGASSLAWRDDALVIDIDERSTPSGRRLTGRVRVRPAFLNETAFILDREGHHDWQPIAPIADIDVAMSRPALRWRGDAYVDTNGGRRALELDFDRWDWSRSSGRDGASIAYAATLADQRETALALNFDPQGGLTHVHIPPAVRLNQSGWRVSRTARSEQVPEVVRTLEDTPFYARSLLAVGTAGEPKYMMHESLSLKRFKSTWVRCLLPFRMPRRA